MYADDEDLSDVIRNVRRYTQVNDPLTRAYLEAGVRLVESEFHQNDDNERLLRPFETLTRDNVIAEVANGRKELPRKGTIGTFRDHWASFSDYLADLARFTLRVQRFAPSDILAHEATPELAHGDFVAGVHEVAYRDMRLATSSVALRFRFLATTLAMQDPDVAEAMTSVYEDVTDTWRNLCDTVLSARGLTLRAGLSTEDLALLLVAINEGLSLRAANDPDCAIRDDETRRGLLGYAALALFAGAVDTGDGCSLDEHAKKIAADGHP